MFNGEMNVVLESEHRTPGNLRAFYQVKMRNMKSGKLNENRFRSGESIDFIRVDKKNYQYSYRDGNALVFMDMTTYDQVHVDEIMIGNSVNFLTENQECQLSFVNGTVIAAELPVNVVLRVLKTEPGLRGDTATNVLKPAEVETGASVNVPIFINENDLIRVDTRAGSYMERVKE